MHKCKPRVPALIATLLVQTTPSVSGLGVDLFFFGELAGEEAQLLQAVYGLGAVPPVFCVVSGYAAACPTGCRDTVSLHGHDRHRGPVTEIRGPVDRQGVRLSP
mmetsp:Transcript_718/g.1688  ORF Transcript_718/g.1688 Transcript_718/m.1688 type:complete len:104 (+) Transcript_718:1318-1629(+)